MLALLFGIKCKKKMLAKPNNAKKSASTIGKSRTRTNFLQYHPPFWLLRGTGSRTGNKNFCKWYDNFRSDRTDHLLRWTTLTGKFPLGPKRSVYFSTEISGNFGIIENTPCFPDVFFLLLISTVPTHALSQHLSI